MNNQIKDRNEIEDFYKWDLSSLFKSDEEWKKTFDALSNDIQALARFEGTLNTPSNIYTCLKEVEEVSKKVENVYGYAHLKHSEDTRSEAGNNMYMMAHGKLVEFVSTTSYIHPEILNQSEEVINSFINNEEYSEFKFFAEDFLRQKSHLLSSKEELLIASMGEALSTSGRVSEILMDADMIFEDAIDSEGNKHHLTNANFVSLEMSLDRKLRESAFRNYYDAYKKHNHTLAATYNGEIKKATAMAKVRNYTSSRNMAMDVDNIPEFVYDNLIETVHKHMDLMHRYVKIRKQILDVDELHYYDVYTPLVKDLDKEYSYEDAKEIILEALKPLGEEYVSIVKDAFNSRWIDVYPSEGKSSGAFSSGTYESNPYILTNYTNNLNSVSTVAHEMGHSMHTYFTNRTQPHQYAEYTMFVAEVASTVNENLLIEHLLKNENDPKVRLSLLNQYLEGFKGTVYRQTMFAEFEKEAHAMSERGEPISAEALNTLYLKLIKEYFGEELVIDEEVQYEWSRIPHFYRPFYVYVYATGYSSATALSQKIINEGEEAVKNYLEFLTMGGSAYPLDELIHAGVDLNTPKPIEEALKRFESALDEVEELINK